MPNSKNYTPFRSYIFGRVSSAKVFYPLKNVDENLLKNKMDIKCEIIEGKTKNNEIIKYIDYIKEGSIIKIKSFFKNFENYSIEGIKSYITKNNEFLFDIYLGSIKIGRIKTGEINKLESDFNDKLSFHSFYNAVGKIKSIDKEKNEISIYFI